MSAPADDTIKLLDDNFVSFWDIVRKQFFRNRVAVCALVSLAVVVVIAIAAPLIALNVPYTIRYADGTREWPLFIKLFDGHVFASGVDHFFNILLVILPAWLLAAAVIRRTGLDGSEPRIRGLAGFGTPLVLLIAFYATLASQENSRYGHLLGIIALGIAWMAGTTYLSRDHSAREIRRIRSNSRIVLLALVGIATYFMVAHWSFTSPSVIYRHEVEEHAAISPPIFFHPDNRNDDQSYVLERTLQPPSFTSGNFLGCDNNGRDVFTRLIYGARISLTIGIVAVSIYVTIGIFLGSLAGYFGGKTDLFIMFVLQVMMCIPSIFLILAIIALFDTRSIFMIMAAIGAISWTGVTRLVRGEFFRQRSIEYVTAAKCLGIPERKIIFGHILKNSVGPVLVSAAFGIAGAVLTESFLAFLGLGDTNAPSWGQLLKEGQTHRKEWLLYCPGLSIFFLVTTLNIIGEGIRDALDPKLRT